MRLIFRLFPYDFVGIAALVISLAALFYLTKLIYRLNDESVAPYGILFVVAPVLFGLFGAREGSLLIGMAVGGLVSIFTTTFFGNLRLKSSLLLALASSATVGLATIVVNLLFK